jgi:hypothetical protein
MVNDHGQLALDKRSKPAFSCEIRREKHPLSANNARLQNNAVSLHHEFIEECKGNIKNAV